MRVLLLSDTHGNIDIINQLVDKTKSEMVIHAGDFGFYDESSYRHLSSRELFLLITHSPLEMITLSISKRIRTNWLAS